jgi:predicted GIY-YIG superfamily endonuclease
MSKAWIYILRCADDSYYVGHTTNLEMRLAEHQAGEGGEWTKRHLPVELVFSQEQPLPRRVFPHRRNWLAGAYQPVWYHIAW